MFTSFEFRTFHRCFFVLALFARSTQNDFDTGLDCRSYCWFHLWKKAPQSCVPSQNSSIGFTFFPVCLNIQAHRIKLLQKNFHSNWITFESNLEIFYFRNIFSSFHPPVLHSTSFLMNYLWVFCVTKAMRYTPNSTPLETIDIFIFGRHIFLYLSVTFSLCKLHKKKRKKRKNGKRTSICRTQTKTNKKKIREQEINWFIMQNCQKANIQITLQ